MPTFATQVSTIRRYPWNVLFCRLLARIWVFAVLASAGLYILLPETSMAADACASVRNNFVNVRDFGARGDGATDDTVALNAAFACAASLMISDPTAHAQAAIYFPQGTYAISNRITFTRLTSARNGESLTIRGDGPQKSVILLTRATGALYLHLAANFSWFNYAVSIHDLGFVAGVPSAGAAIQFVPEHEDTTVGKTPKISPILKSVSFTGRTSSDYFTYGMTGTRLFLPTLKNVVFVGDSMARATTCFLFDHSYGIIVLDVSCAGAVTGVDAPSTAEGNIIIRSRFDNVNTAIRMEVIPGDVPGPSSLDGKILNNTIAARSRGVDIDSKTYFTISGNTFMSLAGAGVYQDVTLRDTQKVFVTGNTFSGSGANRIGVQILRGTKPWPNAASVTTVAQNTFGGMNTGVFVGNQVNSTMITNNTFTGTVNPIVDHGVATHTTAPVGIFGIVQSNGNLLGFAYDPDAPSQSLNVAIYKDGPRGSGTLAATIPTSFLRQDVNALYSITGNHGFQWLMPASDSATSHRWYVYAINAENPSSYTLLSGSPKIFPSTASCTLSAPATVAPGQTITVAWTTKNTVSGNLAQGTTSLKNPITLPNGSFTTTAPATAGTYNYSAAVADTSSVVARCNVTVRVTP